MKLDLILTNDWLEATWYNENEAQVYCGSYSGHSEHIAMLRAKALEYGTDITDSNEALIQKCISDFVYPTEEELATTSLATFKAEVQTALNATTITVLRCYQAGIAFPTEWKTYVDTLRGLLSATEVTTLPTKPDYPEGS